MDPPPCELHRGTRPLVVSVPHAGTFVPDALRARFTAAARSLPDTDWHVDRLYGFARALGASLLVATHSRYVIDLNRPPDDHNLYPGQDTTGLCPIDTFDRAPLYAGELPSASEIAERSPNTKAISASRANPSNRETSVSPDTSIVRAISP